MKQLIFILSILLIGCQSTNSLTLTRYNKNYFIKSADLLSEGVMMGNLGTEVSMLMKGDSIYGTVKERFSNERIPNMVVCEASLLSNGEMKLGRELGRTDSNGEYSISSKDFKDEYLVFYYVGYVPVIFSWNWNS